MNLNQRTIGIGIGLLAVLGVGLYGFQAYQDKKTAEGRTALYEVSQVQETEVKALPLPDQAPGVAFDVKAKLPKTVDALTKIMQNKVGNAQTQFEAAFLLGSLYLEHANSKPAAEVFSTATAQASGSFQKSSLYWLLGQAYEQALMFKEANESFQQGLTKSIEGMKSVFLLGLVRTHIKLNEKEKAKLYFEKLNQAAPGTKFVTDAEELMK